MSAISEFIKDLKKAKESTANGHFVRAAEFAKETDFDSAIKHIKAGILSIKGDRSQYLEYTDKENISTFDMTWTQLSIT